MKSEAYDKLLLETIGNNHIKNGTVYYDNTYYIQLVKKLAEDGILNKYCGELSSNSQGVKMCSIASSSRFCYLLSKGKYKEIDEYEKTDIKNGCCRPHYDGYSAKNHTFFEFKCHELCNESHHTLSDSYKPLLKNIFGIDSNDLTTLKFSDFALLIEGNPSIYRINFDFKQFICHILGILSIASKTRKAILKYVWIVPSIQKNKELKDFIDKVKKQICDIFNKFAELEINHNGQRVKVKDIIEFQYDIVPANEIHDFVLAELD